MNLEKLSASELDALIERAKKLRATKAPPHPSEMPNNVLAIPDPAWTASMIDNKGVALSFRHPGLGWLGFALPQNELMNMFEALGKCIAAHKKSNGSAH